MKKTILAAMAAASLGSAAQAAEFLDGSFETIITPPGSYLPISAGSSLGPWTVTTGQIDLMNETAWNPDFKPSDGKNSIDMNGSTGAKGGVAQTFDTVTGGLYTVTFDMNANVYDYFQGEKLILAQAAGFSGEFGYDTTLHPIGQGGPWTTHSFDFTASSSSTTLSFTSIWPAGASVYGALLDNVTVTYLGGEGGGTGETGGAGAVPEPASWAMMIGGFAAMGMAIRRTRRTNLSFA